MTELKKDSHLISQHIKALKEGLILPESQKFWPDFLYHFTDIKNAIKILSGDRCLYSRNHLASDGQIQTDSACAEIIEKTDPEYKNYVRLYFRPRTPTLFCVEGIRTPEELTYGAHCPVPVYFIFNAFPILSQESTKFSNGNLSVGDVKVSDSVDFYLNLPFDKIYHDRRLPDDNEEEKKSIIFHRHAEVMIPQSMDLDHLRFIYFRSKAEFQTLSYWLKLNGSHELWHSKIGIDEKSNLFFSRWLFVQDVSMNASQIVIKLNPPENPNMITMKCNITNPELNLDCRWDVNLGPATNYNAPFAFNLQAIGNPLKYEFTIWLDGNLAFQNYYNEAHNDPF